MTSQITDSILLIEPVAFHKNKETAVNNYFQHNLEGVNESEIQAQAVQEFKQFRAQLEVHGINVKSFTDLKENDTPDSIFPNNWVSFHDDGSVLLYPMFAPNRRLERRQDILKALEKDFLVREVHDLSYLEEKKIFLESTGSLIFDRACKKVYAALSERTHIEGLKVFADLTGYEPITFHANQSVNGLRMPIYHTNVMMSIGENFAVICLDSIDDVNEKETVVKALEESAKEIIPITEQQVEHFAGNILQLRNEKMESFIVMSTAAFDSLQPEQIEKLEQYGLIVHSPITTIETLGGGGVRCMMGEIFLPKRLID